MIAFKSVFLRRTSATVAVLLLLTGMAGTTGCVYEDELGNIGSQLEGINETIQNLPPTVVNDGDVTVAPSNISVDTPDVTVIVTNPPPASQPATPTPSALELPDGAISYIADDVTGLILTLMAGTWSGSFEAGILDDLPEDWRNVVRTTHRLTALNLSGDPVTITPIVVEGGINGQYVIDPLAIDPASLCLQTTLTLRNSISGAEGTLELPETCR